MTIKNSPIKYNKGKDWSIVQGSLKIPTNFFGLPQKRFGCDDIFVLDIFKFTLV